MERCFKEWKRVLVPGGKAFVVIGDGIVSKKPVPVGDIFVEIMEDMGMELTDRWIRNLQTTRKSFNQNARINREHLLLLKKR
jgi:DNA modification methylase